jgi:hypothetical protein
LEQYAQVRQQRLNFLRIEHRRFDEHRGGLGGDQRWVRFNDPLNLVGIRAIVCGAGNR